MKNYIDQVFVEKIEDIDSALKSVDAMNSLLNDVAKTAYNSALGSFIEGTSGVVVSLVEQYLAMKEESARFYKAHPELIGREEEVKKMYYKVLASANGESYNELLNKVAQLISGE